MTRLVMEPQGFVQRQQRFLAPLTVNTTKGSAGSAVCGLSFAAAGRSVASLGRGRVRARIGFAVVRRVAHDNGERGGAQAPFDCSDSEILLIGFSVLAWQRATPRRCSFDDVLGRSEVRVARRNERTLRTTPVTHSSSWKFRIHPSVGQTNSSGVGAIVAATFVGINSKPGKILSVSRS
jgi:hypothetical protein